MTNHTKELHILDYWYINEFLDQNSLEEEKIRRDAKNRLNESDNVKTLKYCLSLDRSTDILRQIKTSIDELSRDYKPHKLTTWGNITVYLGKIEREDCIKKIAKLLGSKEERPEKNKDYIAWASLQLNPDGIYVVGSFDLSPILWALKELQNSGSKNISDNLSLNTFEQDKNEIEAILNETLSHSQENEMIKFEHLRNLLSVIQEKYVGPLELGNQWENTEKQELSLVFTAYLDEETREKNSAKDFEYNNLSQTFYMDDMKWLYDEIANGRVGYDGMDGAIRKYITEASNDFNHHPTIKRKNVINIKEDKKSEYRDFLMNALDVQNTPIAKWPSRFRPSLMQQIAVNAATSKISGAFPDVKYPIFSVNGPPGSGKTTLLKEIIANNVVERAKCLAEYQQSDHAFTVRKFKHGRVGNTYYNEYHRNFYSLKNDKINDYGMLVVSSNNTAVENITKELPQEEKLLKDLRVSSGDSEQVKQSLEEIRSYYIVDNSEDEQSYKFYNKTINRYEKIKEKDIYFSKLASNLLGSKEKDKKEAWGLIAAPLGNRNNIKDFTYQILAPILDILPNSKFPDDSMDYDYYHREYGKVRKDFQRQLDIVEKMQNQLASQSKIFTRYYKASNVFPQQKRDFQDQKKTLLQQVCQMQSSLSVFEEDLTQKKQESRELAEVLAEKQNELKQSQESIDKLENDILEKRQLAFDALNRLGFWAKLLDKLLGGDKQKATQQLADEYDKQCQRLQEKISIEEMNCQSIKSDAAAFEEELQKYSYQKSSLEQEIQELQRNISEKRQEMKQQEKAFKQTESEYLKLQEQVEAARVPKEPMESYTPLDQELIDKLTGSDEKEITAAQVENPWLTARYDREREKLFYLAIRLNKYFVLSSKSCKENLHHLFAYMTGKYKGEKEYVEFHPEDKQILVPAIYQTLFLLVPVVSSTFASVGKFLADLKVKNSIGMLIVDEAGQAQPQMALGALNRSRRAIIVGDPRQVEPIVTDDLRLLKGAFRGDSYAAYKEKNISVQKCADLINPYGNYLENGTEYPEWVGSPLIVHRRCISPMYEISNAISYDGMMKQQTKEPDEKLKRTFVGSSCWINIAGNERGNKDHYNERQGERAVELVFKAFELVKEQENKIPSLFIITPFNTVKNGISDALRIRRKQREHGHSGYAPEEKSLNDWIKNNIGTVHKFQGKEADQVIFLLGCDTSQAANGAINWVNSNIVNVAVTRAKYRLYVIGDIQAWQKNEYVQKAKAIIDTYKLKEIDKNDSKDLDSKEAAEINNQLPNLASFPVSETINEAGEKELSVETAEFIDALNTEQVYARPLTDEQLHRFGFQTYAELQQLSSEVRKNIEWGIKIYYLMQRIYLENENLDASCCAILFCKALELHVKDCLLDGLKVLLPTFKAKRKTTLSEIKPEDTTLGTFGYIFENNMQKIEEHLAKRGFPEYDEKWLETYKKKLSEAKDKRNHCCHSGLFKYIELNSFLKDMFEENYSSPADALPSDGLIFTSQVGKKL
ncbi:DEAD/DEAH box helicase [Streptococcus panodentis]|nr:AAA domain-containing protein [Streptococcus panodentis]